MVLRTKAPYEWCYMIGKRLPSYGFRVDLTSLNRCILIEFRWSNEVGCPILFSTDTRFVHNVFREGNATITKEYSTHLKRFVQCHFYTKSIHPCSQHNSSENLPESCGVGKPVDNMWNGTDFLNIIKEWRKSHLRAQYQLSCTFLYGAPYKNLSHLHISWYNSKQWTWLWFLELLPIEV